MTKDQSETTKVEPAPPSADKNTTIRVVFELELRPKDQKVPDRVTLANKVVERMSETIFRGNFFPPSKGDITLKITVVACSEGSRWGRICCGELGMGWVMLDCDWLLMRGDAKLTEPKTQSLRSSGAIGFTDMCDENFGENTILNDLCYKMAEKIGKKSAAALSHL
jgi:hypothetical protein